MGHGNVVYINASIDIAARNPNVYLETSGMPMHTKIRRQSSGSASSACSTARTPRFHHPAVEILQVRVSGLAPEELERVLRANGRALFLGQTSVQDAGGDGAQERCDNRGKAGHDEQEEETCVDV